MPSENSKEREERIAQLQAEVETLRNNLSEAPKRTRTLEERLLETKGKLAQAVARNKQLDNVLRQSRERYSELREAVDTLTRPPSAYGNVLAVNEDNTLDVFSNGRKLRVSYPLELNGKIKPGQEVALNATSSVVLARSHCDTGEVATLKETLSDGRLLATTQGGEERILRASEALLIQSPRAGDLLLVTPNTELATEVLPSTLMPDLVLEEIPLVTYADIGGLDTQIEKITDAVELPFLHPDVFEEHKLPYPKGILLYGPPGCGKTLIAKAVANSLARKMDNSSNKGEPRSYFLNVKGPEILNKYVGETERQIRQIFRQAKDRAEEGWPVIIFFDEMESMFRMRGSGISSDMESTVVPQLLAEIDGVEELRNVIVVGASNREDLIDPAVLRPGRLDVKIKIDRPDSEAAADIFARYLTPDLPIAQSTVDSVGGGELEKAVRGTIEQAVTDLYATEPRTELLEITYEDGEQEIMYFRDWISGAMIENIVRRAKRQAVKRFITSGEKGITAEDLLESVGAEFVEFEDLPNTSQPATWAKLVGRKGGRIIHVRNLMGSEEEPDAVGPIERVGTGQYL